MKIALACDHAGYNLLREVQMFVESLGHETVNYGPKSLNTSDDYPDYIIPAANAVAGKACDMGIIIGGSGQGEAMTANRVGGVRCAVFYGPAVARRSVDVQGHKDSDPFEIIKLSREHNNANMLSLAARFLSQNEIEHAIKLWLETPFSNEPRHIKRIAKIDRGIA